MIPSDLLQEVEDELKYQESKKWKDDDNTPGHWCTYIANYATRWAMPFSFNPQKYTFRKCMVKVIALAISAVKSEPLVVTTGRDTD